MAVLTDNDRQELTAAWMRADAEPCVLSKAQLRTALNAADDWMESILAAFTSAMPTVARNNLTARQRSRLLTLVVSRRLEFT